MRGRVWAATVACVLTIQPACGLETVELRGSDDARGAGDGTDVDIDEPTLEPDNGASVSPPNTSLAEGANPPLVPAGGAFEGDGFESPPPLEKGCRKVDFLFVIDNSFSMAFAQENLRNSFEGFMAVIGDQVDADDFHIMVVDTDSWENDDESEDDGGDGCRDVLGAGRRTNGTTGADCGLPGSDRFMTLDQPDLEATFSCMASVGNFGDNDEAPIDALLAANARAANAPQGCNAGFAREDAVLVVTLITNADDEASLDAPEDWLESLLAQKGGEANAQNAVVVLGLIGDGRLQPPASDLGCLIASQRQSPRLSQFVQGLEHGELAGVCADDYSPFFEQAVLSIDTACTEFTPPVIQ